MFRRFFCALLVLQLLVSNPGTTCGADETLDRQTANIAGPIVVTGKKELRNCALTRCPSFHVQGGVLTLTNVTLSNIVSAFTAGAIDGVLNIISTTRGESGGGIFSNNSVVNLDPL